MLTSQRRSFECQIKIPILLQLSMLPKYYCYMFLCIMKQEELGQKPPRINVG